MEAQADKSTNPILIVAAIALILFCAAGIAAIMGWIPASIGGSADSQTADAPGKAPARAPLAEKRQGATDRKAAAPAQVAGKAGCAECGVIESVQEIDTKGQGTGLGGVGGAVVGGLLGNQVGGGRGKDVMTVVGAVGGAVAGNEVEKRVKATTSYEITVRLNDGSSRVISEASAPTWRIGDKVKIVNGAIQSNA